jgi:hypothetical protein
MTKIQERLYEATLRMETIILLAGMVNDGDAIADPLRELLEEEDDDQLQRCFPDMPASLIVQRDDEDAFREAFNWWLTDADKAGFVIRFGRPVMRWNATGDGATYSWGNYYTRWLYGDTVEQALQLAEQWAAELDVAGKAEAAQAAKERTS